jgi:hypothetical protein
MPLFGFRLAEGGGYDRVRAKIIEELQEMRKMLEKGEKFW